VVVSAKPLKGIQQHKARADHRAQAHRHDGGLVVDANLRSLNVTREQFPQVMKVGFAGQLVAHVSLHCIYYSPRLVGRDLNADQGIIQRIQMFHERCSGDGNSLQCPAPGTVNRVH